jgi:hypothetical protein
MAGDGRAFLRASESAPSAALVCDRILWLRIAHK